MAFGRRGFHVIHNAEPAFLARHGRLKTLAEMDAEEAALRASGDVMPGEDVGRIYI